MIRCKDECREIGYEKPLRLSGEIRFAAVGDRSMVVAVVPLIDKIISFHAMTSNNSNGIAPVQTSLQ
jgi:hypothetical protein